MLNLGNLTLEILATPESHRRVVLIQISEKSLVGVVEVKSGYVVSLRDDNNNLKSKHMLVFEKWNSVKSFICDTFNCLSIAKDFNNTHIPPVGVFKNSFGFYECKMPVIIKANIDNTFKPMMNISKRQLWDESVIKIKATRYDDEY